MEKTEVIEAINELKKYQTETNKIEVKTALGGFPKCYDTISSFSNKYGGLIIFGINEENDFSIEGVYDLNDLQKRVSDLCCNSMVPAVRPDLLPFDYEGKKLLAVKIDELSQNKKPCYFSPSGLRKGSYTRIGDKDQRMTDYEIYALQSYNDYVFEDKRPARNASIDDLNNEALVSYINKIKLQKSNFSKNTFDKCLKLCGITDSSDNQVYPTLAGMMIFGDYPQSFYPQLFVACVVIPGKQLGDTGEYGERFIDNKRIEGTIEEMLDGTMNFLRRNMKTRVIINSNGERISRTEYPLDALREAVANSLIHRDYSTQTENAYISVNMYSDRIEIINPGTLYGTNRLEKLGTATTMEARNPTIVRILEEKGSVIENRHSGIPTMKREMKKYGLPEPEFYEERDSFKVIFKNTLLENDVIEVELVAQQNGKSAQQNGKSAQQNEKSAQQNGKSAQQNDVSAQQKNSVDEMKIRVLEYCNEAHTAREICEYLNISRSRVSRAIIRPLIECGKLEYTNKKSIYARNQKYIRVNNDR